MLPALREFLPIWNFDVLPEDNDARPVVVAPNLFDLHANQGIRTHPLDLPAHGGEATQTVGVVGEIKGHDVRPVVGGTREPPIAKPREHHTAFPASHLGNQHRWLTRGLPGARLPKSTSLGFVVTSAECQSKRLTTWRCAYRLSPQEALGSGLYGQNIYRGCWMRAPNSIFLSRLTVRGSADYSPQIVVARDGRSLFLEHSGSHQVTDVLARWRSGDRAELDALMLLVTHGVPKLLDFGIAKILDISGSTIPERKLGIRPG